MALNRESLPVLFDRVYAAYMSRLKPLDKTARHNLIRVMSEVEAGMYHQLLGDLSFLADQIFPVPGGPYKLITVRATGSTSAKPHLL